ncbi:MAG: hypothetical protein NT085_01485 [candidate division SR1 bacterium]|nr:hypothetical protein [candidate division SR1 bacterium]
MGGIETSTIYEEVKHFATQKLEEMYSNQDSEIKKTTLEYMIPKSTKNIIQFKEITGYELTRVLSYVEKTEIDSRVDRSHIYMIPSVALCQKLGINEGYAMNIKRCFDFMHTINEGNYLPQDCMTLNDHMIEKELVGETKSIFLDNVNKRNHIDQISETLFLLYDYQNTDGSIVFSPQKAFEELASICGEGRVQENKKQLIDICKFFVQEHRADKENTEPIDLYQDIFSPTGMKNFINRYGIRMFANNEGQLRLYRKIYECGGIDWDPSDYRHFVEMSLEDLKIEDSSIIIEIKENKLIYQNWYRDTILRKILNDRSGSRSNINIERPRDIEGYTDDIFLVHKKEVLKDIQTFAQNELFEQKATHDYIRGITLLKDNIKDRLTHMNGLMAFLEDCGKIPGEEQTRIFIHLKKIRSHIINRPFDIQQNFFSVGHDLIGEYPEIYEKLLEYICNISKQKRKHMVQDIFPELHTTISLVKSMNIKIDEKEQIESPYKNQIKEFIEDIIKSDGTQYGTGIDEIKKEYIENNFHLTNTDMYVQEKKQMMEYFIHYSCNIHGMDAKRLAQIGAMASLHHNDLRKQRRVDHTIEIPDMTDEGKKLLIEGEADETKAYWEKHITPQDLLALQETTSFATIIKPQTPAEKIYTIQESFESIYDPDIYKEEIKPIAKKFFESKDKSIIMKSLSQEERNIVIQMPIINFITNIEKLHLDEIRSEIEENQATPEKIQQAKNTINQAREIFRDIVKAYKEIQCPESVDIRLEEIANNFALEINELDRSMEEVEGLNQEVKLISYISADMQEVIPNIRGCLGCLSKSGSNHKNLDFQDPNRFLIVSYPDGSGEKSIADQIALILPSEIGPCLVMDRIYGFRSLDVLINHSLNAIKKAASTDMQLHVFIPKISIESAGTNMSTYFKTLQYACKEIFPKVKIEIQSIQFDGTYAGYNECGLKNNKENEGILISLQKEIRI